MERGICGVDRDVCDKEKNVQRARRAPPSGAWVGDAVGAWTADAERAWTVGAEGAWIVGAVGAWTTDAVGA
eukprot:1138965-Pelagomonas_calceolata.AAC.3